jgi:polyferredoxin
MAVSALLGGLSLGPCLTAYAAGPRAVKPLLRRLVLITGGLSILAPALIDGTSLDLEGFFALLFAGTAGAAIVHTLITVVFGPLVFGRVLCGWGCWRSMALELLPVGAAAGRRPWMLLAAGPAGTPARPLPFRSRRLQRALKPLPLVGLSLSVGAGAFLALTGHPMAAGSQPSAPVAIAALIVTYSALSIGLALLCDDQRAFCKHLCPTGAILRWTARPAILRVGATAARCDGCGACSRACPMEIDVARSAQSSGFVPSSRCILCQRCVDSCSRQALRLSFGFAGGAPRPAARHDGDRSVGGAAAGPVVPV